MWSINYDFVDDGTDPTDGSRTSGLVRNNLSPEPAYDALAANRHTADRSTIQAVCGSGSFRGGVRVLLARRQTDMGAVDPQTRTARWDWIARCARVNLPVSGAIETITDL